MVFQVPCFSALGQGDDAIGFVQSCWQSTHADICSLPASQTNLNQEIYTHSITRAHAHAWWNIQLVFPMHAHTQLHVNTFNHIERHWWCLVSKNIAQWYTKTHTHRCGQLFDRPVASLKYVLKGSLFARSCNIGTAHRIYSRCVECEAGVVWGDPDRI